MRIIFVIPLFAMLLIIACKKDKKEDEPKRRIPTQNGSNIMYFKVNSEERIYRGKPTYFKPDGVVFYSYNFPDKSKAFEIIGDNSDYGDELNLVVSLQNDTNSKTAPNLNEKYKIKDHTPYIQSGYYINNPYAGYSVDSTTSYIYFTRFDDNIASGIFEFHGSHSNDEHVDITEGFFDIVRDK